MLKASYRNKIIYSVIGFVIGIISCYLEIRGILIPKIDTLSKLAEIVTALSVFVATYAFVYQVHKDSADSAIEQLLFFKEKILPEANKLFVDVKNYSNVTSLPKIENIPELSLEWIRKNRKIVSDQQIKPFIDNSILNTQFQDVSNTLEVFSQQLIHKNTINHRALVPVRPNYIAFIELGASILCTSMYLNKDVYRGIKKVYDAWKDTVDRDDLKAKIQKTRELLNIKDRNQKP